MIFKWIKCTIDQENKSSFSEAQKKWNKTSKAKGFIAQLGGWDTNNKNNAFILSVWNDKESFNKFMENLHDVIIEENNQAATYNDCTVTFFNPISKMPGKKEDLISSIQEARYLRFADCTVKKQRISHFKKVQNEVWIPSMSQTKGMMGGNFSVNSSDPSRFLVATLWDNSTSHLEYVKHKVPLLRESSNLKDDLLQMEGSFIELIPDWLVTP